MIHEYPSIQAVIQDAALSPVKIITVVESEMIPERVSAESRQVSDITFRRVAERLLV